MTCPASARAGPRLTSLSAAGDVVVPETVTGGIGSGVTVGGVRQASTRAFAWRTSSCEEVRIATLGTIEHPVVGTATVRVYVSTADALRSSPPARSTGTPPLNVSVTSTVSLTTVVGLPNANGAEPVALPLDQAAVATFVPEAPDATEHV